MTQYIEPGENFFSHNAHTGTSVRSGNPRTDWFRNLGLGLFIHWGPYSLLGHGEWAIHDERIPLDEYDAICNGFTAQDYNPRRWAEWAAGIGVKYMMLTACHGDGFCLFDTDSTERNSVRMGPGRDLVAEYVEACREVGLGVGLYCSLSNWYENYNRLGAYITASNLLENPRYRDPWREIVEIKHQQIKELITGYGEVDILWLDDPPSVPESYHYLELESMIRAFQPNILINNRGKFPGDFEVCEERLASGEASHPFEVCMPIAHRWGHHRGDKNYKTSKTLVSMLSQTVAGRGNFLVNVGPTAEGIIPEQQVGRVEEMGQWFLANQASLRNVRVVNPEHAEWGELLTCSGNTLYVHVERWISPTFAFCGLRNKVKRVSVLATGQDIDFEQRDPDRLVMRNLPGDPPSDLCTVIAIEFEGELDYVPILIL